MPTTVSIAWLPVTKRSESNSAISGIKSYKDQKLTTPGLEDAYQGTPTDANEPKAVGIIYGKFSRWIQLLSKLLYVKFCKNSLGFPRRSQGGYSKPNRLRRSGNCPTRSWASPIRRSAQFLASSPFTATFLRPSRPPPRRSRRDSCLLRARPNSRPPPTRLRQGLAQRPRTGC
jgi:hypothetical protein